MSDQNSSNLVRGEDGNTNTLPAPSASKSKQCSGAKRWCFTWNNFNENDIAPLCRRLDDLCESYVFQEEIGEKTGTIHLQGAIWLLEKRRFTEFRLPKTIHWSTMRNEQASSEYCMKPNTATGRKWSKGFSCNISVVEPTKPWQLELLRLYDSEPDRRTVHWRWEDVGCVGKSSFCKWMYVKKGALVIRGGKKADLINIIFKSSMNNVRMVIWDLPRATGGKISTEAIECILDGFVTNTKYETGSKVFEPPHVLVLANAPPDDTSVFSADRWDIQEIR